jgi:HTH-type transcriptional regulator / antitoxin HigA
MLPPEENKMPTKLDYQPDYTVSPGEVLEERLDAQEISHAEFARRCGRSPKLISEIISGKAPVEPETALQFEKVLGVAASIWLGIEADYQLHKAKQAETESAAGAIEWASSFPVKELVERRYIPKPTNSADCVCKLLAFFGVGSVSAWRDQFATASVSYRHSPTFQSSAEAIATWLRIGERAALEQQCAEYNETKFRSALKEIRSLTREVVENFMPAIRIQCNASGVAFVLTRSFRDTALSGAAWWVSPKKAVIQLSLRHMSDDHLWFSFFHEAAHILLHSKKDIFVEGNGDDVSEAETEANEWASNFLVPRARWTAFKATRPRSKAEVCAFADEQGIATGVVVGMLQHDGVVPWGHMNNLKERYEWTE